MKKLFAVAVLVLALCAIAQVAKAPQASKPPAVAAQANHVGKYEMFFSPHARADVYLVDTETGQLWRPITISNASDTNFKGKAPEVWVYQERIDSEQDFDTWMAFHKQSTPATTPPQ